MSWEFAFILVPFLGIGGFWWGYQRGRRSCIIARQRGTGGSVPGEYARVIPPDEVAMCHCGATFTTSDAADAHDCEWESPDG